MPWKIYVWMFAVINVLSIVSFQYNFGQYIGLLSLILSALLNIAAFSYAYKKTIFPKPALDWLFKLNIGLFGIFFLFEFLTFFQEAIGVGISLPTSGLVSVIASFPSLPALYATYKLAYEKAPGKNSKRKT